jgi:hypothetical protein
MGTVSRRELSTAFDVIDWLQAFLKVFGDCQYVDETKLKRKVMIESNLNNSVLLLVTSSARHGVYTKQQIQN